MRIELSLPKFLYGNNVDELTTEESTLNMIVDKLQSAIANDLGIKYPKEDILSADVTKLHVGKNFMFDDPGAPIFMIETISKTRADRIYDNNNTKYENLGSSFRLHSNTKDIIFYDKKRDIVKSMKSPKRAEDGITYRLSEPDSPISLFMSDKKASVLRLEIRLNNRKRIRQAFPELGDDLSFQNVFLESKIMDCIAKEWHEATDEISMIQLGKEDPCLIFERIIADETSKYSLRDSLAVATAIHIIGLHGINYLREIVEKYFNRDEWYRLKKKIVTPNYQHFSCFKKVDDELQQYNPLRLGGNLQ